MIVSRICNGLGNQMFQYATGYALAKRAGLPFKLDTSWHHTQDADRDFLLNHWLALTPSSLVETIEAGSVPQLVEETRKLCHQPLARYRLLMIE